LISGLPARCGCDGDLALLGRFRQKKRHARWPGCGQPRGRSCCSARFCGSGCRLLNIRAGNAPRRAPPGRPRGR
jgi:hypothetical protein